MGLGMIHGIVSGLDGANAFMQIQHQSEGGVSIQIIPMQSFTAKEAQAFIKSHGGGVGDFCFQRNLRDALL